jgi:hypothetical protein
VAAGQPPGGSRRAGLPLVAGLLLGQALAFQVLFSTRW